VPDKGSGKIACLTGGYHCEGLQGVSFLHDNGLRREILGRERPERKVGHMKKVEFSEEARKNILTRIYTDLKSWQ
jgi:hypothetical protein